MQMSILIKTGRTSLGRDIEFRSGFAFEGTSWLGDYFYFGTKVHCRGTVSSVNDYDSPFLPVTYDTAGIYDKDGQVSEIRASHQKSAVCR